MLLDQILAGSFDPRNYECKFYGLEPGLYAIYSDIDSVNGAPFLSIFEIIIQPY